MVPVTLPRMLRLHAARHKHMKGCCAGCDALSVHLILTVIAGTLSVGLSWRSVVAALGVMIPWQLAHWEEYHTGKTIRRSSQCAVTLRLIMATL